jgi:predicted O-methyltransferase YrrM
MAATLDELLKLIDVPETNKSTPIKDSEAHFLHNFVKENGIKKTAETGCGYGKSAIAIMSATGNGHIIMDPFQSFYKYGGVNNIKKAGFGDKLDFQEDYSHNVLPRLADKREKFDFIFIDGNHRFDGIFIDYYYTDFLLNPGGYFMFHDTWMHSTQLVISYIKTNRPDYTVIESPLRNIAIFQKKVGVLDERDGMFHKGFYTNKSWLTHHLIIWLTEGEQTGLKKLVYKLKDIYTKVKPK